MPVTYRGLFYTEIIDYLLKCNSVVSFLSTGMDQRLSAPSFVYSYLYFAMNSLMRWTILHVMKIIFFPDFLHH